MRWIIIIPILFLMFSVLPINNNTASASAINYPPGILSLNQSSNLTIHFINIGMNLPQTWGIKVNNSYYYSTNYEINVTLELKYFTNLSGTYYLVFYPIYPNSYAYVGNNTIQLNSSEAKHSIASGYYENLTFEPKNSFFYIWDNYGYQISLTLFIIGMVIGSYFLIRRYR